VDTTRNRFHLSLWAEQKWNYWSGFKKCFEFSNFLRASDAIKETFGWSIPAVPNADGNLPRFHMFDGIGVKTNFRLVQIHKCAIVCNGGRLHFIQLTRHDPQLSLNRDIRVMQCTPLSK